MAAPALDIESLEFWLHSKEKTEGVIVKTPMGGVEVSEYVYFDFSHSLEIDHHRRRLLPSLILYAPKALVLPRNLQETGHCDDTKHVSLSLNGCPIVEPPYTL